MYYLDTQKIQIHTVHLAFKNIQNSFVYIRTEHFVVKLFFNVIYLL